MYAGAATYDGPLRVPPNCRVVLAAAISPSFPFPVETPLWAYTQLSVVALIVGLVASLAGVRRIARIDPALAFGGA